MFVGNAVRASTEGVAVSINIKHTFARGGKELIDLLEYCVFSMKMDVIFLFLAEEYRRQPGDLKAIALYDVFCAPNSPAWLSARSLLPPFDLRTQMAVQPLKDRRDRIQSALQAGSELVVPPVIPGNFLFDNITRELREHPESVMRQIGEHYDPALTPLQNLPGGKMTASQQAFVDRLWEPELRPYLVAAGFRRIANIA